MSDLDVDAIEARAAAATPGPWKLWGMSVMWDRLGTSDVADTVTIAGTNSYPQKPPRTFNATFIAHARDDVPALVSRVRELEATLAAIETEQRENDKAWGDAITRAGYQIGPDGQLERS